MNAIVFDGPAFDASQTRCAEVDVPTAGPGEVLVEVAYAGINFKDVMVRRGDPGYVPKWPIIPGLEVSGTVAAVGQGVHTVRAGDHVAALTNQGGFAEYAIADARLTCVVPANVSLQAAAVAPAALATAELLLNTVARIVPGDVLVVHSGAGAVGEAIAQLALSTTNDVTLVAFVGSPARAAIARQIGYEHVFVRGSGLVEDVRARLGGQPATVILDSQGTRWLKDDLDLLAPGGRIVLFGNAGGDSFGELPPTSDLMKKNVAVGGFSLAGFSTGNAPAMQNAIARTLDRLADRSIQPTIAIDYGLTSVPRLHQLLATGQGGGRKHVVQVSDLSETSTILPPTARQQPPDRR